MTPRNQKLAAVGLATLTVTATGVITYFATRKRLEAEYDERLAKELQSSLEYLAAKQVDLSKVTISDDLPEEEPDNVDIQVDELDPVEGTRVFGSGAEKPSLEYLAKRNQLKQYNKILSEEGYKEDEETAPEEPIYENPDILVISRDVFMENETEWPQSTLTYFADDGVLDDKGDFVEESTTLIGEATPPFGQMSGDPVIVYLRNTKLEREFEVIQDSGNATDFLAHSLTEMYRPSERR